MTDREVPLCPRRVESPPQFLERMPGPDHYVGGHGLVSQPLGCSWCGSMPPDDFMAAIRDGAQIGPTDKNYKAYITLATGEAKFYFQHLDEPGKREFFELLTSGLLNVGYPGHFYVLPFFITRRSSDGD